MYATQAKTCRARKAHRCTWCDEIIDPGEQYQTWGSSDSGDWITVKMHGECYEAALRWMSEWDAEYLPDEGDMRRGCSCEPGDPCDCRKDEEGKE